MIGIQQVTATIYRSADEQAMEMIILNRSIEQTIFNIDRQKLTTRPVRLVTISRPHKNEYTSYLLTTTLLQLGVITYLHF